MAYHLPRDYVYLWHILVVGPLLLYVGWQQGNVPSWVWTVLLVLGVGVIGYQGYLLWKHHKG